MRDEGVVSWYGARLIFRWRELIFSIKKSYWETTVLPNQNM